MFKNNTVGFSKSLGILGGIGEYSLIKGTMTLVTGKERHEVAIDDVILLEQIGTLADGDFVFNNDVLQHSEDGSLVEIESLENGTLQTYILDRKFVRIADGIVFNEAEFAELSEGWELVGNIHELEAQKKTVDFNIAIFKDFDGTSFTYYYACNNKETEEIDLIKVVFVGTSLIKEEEYTRTTLSHDVFLDSVEAGTLVEVSQSELQNYAYGMMSKGNKITERVVEETPSVEEDWEDEDSCDCEECCGEQLELDDYCEECGELEEECDCRGW